MTDAAVDLWEREAIAAALAGERVCVKLPIPCWVCVAVDVLVEGVRAVTFARPVRTRDWYDWTGEPWWVRTARVHGCAHHLARQV